jgi:hypothetical protein
VAVILSPNECVVACHHSRFEQNKTNNRWEQPSMSSFLQLWLHSLFTCFWWQRLVFQGQFSNPLPPIPDHPPSCPSLLTAAMSFPWPATRGSVCSKRLPTTRPLRGWLPSTIFAANSSHQMIRSRLFQNLYSWSRCQIDSKKRNLRLARGVLICDNPLSLTHTHTCIVLVVSGENGSSDFIGTNTLPTLAGADHQWTIPISTGYF